MNKREYPLFLIDRSKHSAYPFDFVACFDKQCGFVARVVYFPTNEQINEFSAQITKVNNSDSFYLLHRFASGGVVLIIEDFIQKLELANVVRSRIETLLKKGLKKYLYAEAHFTAHGDLGIDNQILQQQETVNRAKQNYNEIVARCLGDKKQANYVIALAEETLRTLKSVKL